MTDNNHAYTVDRLAEFVVNADHSDIGGHARATLKRNVLDSIACAIGALDGELIPAIRAQAEQFSGRPTATFVGGGRASVDQAAFFNAVLVRYPDLLDTYLTPGGLCHPATISAPSWRWPNTSRRPVRTSCWRWQSPTRCNAASVRRFR
jgi:2-methylcitrate dehydratase PrpD